jgi:hypothetical protein
MSFIIAMTVLTLSGWAVLASVRRLRKARAGRVWWITFALLLGGGRTPFAMSDALGRPAARLQRSA